MVNDGLYDREAMLFGDSASAPQFQPAGGNVGAQTRDRRKFGGQTAIACGCGCVTLAEWNFCPHVRAFVAKSNLITLVSSRPKICLPPKPAAGSDYSRIPPIAAAAK